LAGFQVIMYGRFWVFTEEIMAERNLAVDHTTVWRWVQRYAPELNRRVGVASLDLL
jgi:transposase-like protein